MFQLLGVPLVILAKKATELGQQFYEEYKEAKRRKEYEEWKEKNRIANIQFKNIEITNHAEFVNLCISLLDESMHATRCKVFVKGSYSQTISKCYAGLYKIRALVRRGELGSVAASLSVASEIIKEGDPSIIVRHFIKEAAEEVYRDEHFNSVLCLPSADYACIALVAGLHLASNNGDVVILKAGGRDWRPPMPS